MILRGLIDRHQFMIVDNSSRRKLGAGLGLSPRVVGAEIPQMALWIAAGIKTPAVILIFDLHDDRVGPQPRSPAQGFSGTQEHSCSAGMARAAGRRHRGEDNGYRWRSQPGRILKPERGAVIGDQRGDEISRAGRAPRPRGGAVRRPALQGPGERVARTSAAQRGSCISEPVWSALSSAIIFPHLEHAARPSRPCSRSTIGRQTRLRE
jgi:hypothetical protein